MCSPFTLLGKELYLTLSFYIFLRFVADAFHNLISKANKCQAPNAPSQPRDPRPGQLVGGFMHEINNLQFCKS